MRWVFFLQEFDIDIQDKKGSENQVTGHLSHLEEDGRPHDDLEINDSFLDEQLLALSMKEVPWFVDLANCLVSDIILEEFTSNQRKTIKEDLSRQLLGWTVPFRIYTDRVIKRCVTEEEQSEILGCGARTTDKVLSYGFY